jgi:hypothetical protein
MLTYSIRDRSWTRRRLGRIAFVLVLAAAAACGSSPTTPSTTCSVTLVYTRNVNAVVNPTFNLNNSPGDWEVVTNVTDKTCAGTPIGYQHIGGSAIWDALHQTWTVNGLALAPGQFCLALFDGALQNSTNLSGQAAGPITATTSVNALALGAALTPIANTFAYMSLVTAVGSCAVGSS